MRARRLIRWGLVLVLSAAAGGLWLAYAYVTDSETLAPRITAEAAPFLAAEARLEVGRVRLRPLTGEVRLAHVTLWQQLDGRAVPVVQIPWLQVRNDAGAILRGQFVPTQVLVAQPILRLHRRRDGTWNLQGLLADPLPDAPLDQMPTVVVQRGVVELVEDAEISTEATAAPAFLAILRDVMIRIEPDADGLLQFEGSARGDAFDRVRLEGTIDPDTGQVALKGDLSRLVVSEALRHRLPPETREAFDHLGLSGGEIDVVLRELTADPRAEPRWRYDASARLRGGAWKSDELPFPLSDVSALASVRDGALVLEQAEGFSGTTRVRARGTFRLDDLDAGPFHLRLDVIDLELQRLRDWSPPECDDLWAEYRPRGRINLAYDARREQPGGEVGFGLGVDCREVALCYREFPYPLDHVSGKLMWSRGRVHPQTQLWEDGQITVALETRIGGQPAQVRGTIDDPGDDAVVNLDFDVATLPIDTTLLNALPADVRAVVDQFQPTGTVRLNAQVTRTPPVAPDDPPEGHIEVYANLDLLPDGRCAITWEEMPYPIMNLTGRLELAPDHWVFHGMRGNNGLAVITGSGRVEYVTPQEAATVGAEAAGGSDQFRVDLHLRAANLPFDTELKAALPAHWRASWDVLNPTGSSQVEAWIQVEPGREDYRLQIIPEPDTRLKLTLPRLPGHEPPEEPEGDGASILMPLDDVRGTFEFDNGTVTMTDVAFAYRNAPVRVARGRVRVEDSGQFDLAARNLVVTNFQFDAGVRKLMPPIMADFAKRLDDGKTFMVRADLDLAWSGRPGEPVECVWDNTLVVFNGNTIEVGVPLEHLQGQLDHVRGRFDGQELEAHGALSLDSVSLMGQQVTNVSAPLEVSDGVARLTSIRGTLLGGELTGHVTVTLDATPRYQANLQLRQASLEHYAKTVPGHQNFRGNVSGQIAFAGLGNDLRTLNGQGQAHISQGDLGELPAFLQLVKFLTLTRNVARMKTAFDSVDVVFRIRQGQTFFDPIQFIGDAFSLHGRGTMSVQGDLDLRLRVLYGRDAIRLPWISDAMREASGQIFIVRVQGTPSFPKFKQEILPQATDALGDALRSVVRGRRGLGGTPTRR